MYVIFVRIWQPCRVWSVVVIIIIIIVVACKQCLLKHARMYFADLFIIQIREQTIRARTDTIRYDYSSIHNG